jgi:hypothetical protein
MIQLNVPSVQGSGTTTGVYLYQMKLGDIYVGKAGLRSRVGTSLINPVKAWYETQNRLGLVNSEVKALFWLTH